MVRGRGIGDDENYHSRMVGNSAGHSHVKRFEELLRSWIGGGAGAGESPEVPPLDFVHQNLHEVASHPVASAFRHDGDTRLTRSWPRDGKGGDANQSGVGRKGPPCRAGVPSDGVYCT